MSADVIDFSRGVDLSVIRNKVTHQHRWIIVVNYAFDDKVLAQLSTDVQADINARKKAQVAGEEWTGEPVKIPVNMAEDRLIGMDGPGCMKCGQHWQTDEGYGSLCKVSDADFEKAGAPVSTPGAVGIADQQSRASSRARHPSGGSGSGSGLIT